MPSSAQEASCIAAVRLQKERGLEVHVSPKRDVPTQSLADLVPHAQATYELLLFCAELGDGPLHVVARPGRPQVLNVRGGGITAFGERLPASALGDRLTKVQKALAGIQAELLRQRRPRSPLLPSTGRGTRPAGVKDLSSSRGATWAARPSLVMIDRPQADDAIF